MTFLTTFKDGYNGNNRTAATRTFYAMNMLQSQIMWTREVCSLKKAVNIRRYLPAEFVLVTAHMCCGSYLLQFLPPYTH